jgi:hypothetical protein
MNNPELQPWVPRTGSAFFLSPNASLQALHRPTGLSEIGLAKQASVLADSLLIQTGLVFTQTDGWMSSSADMPYHMLDQPTSSLAAVRGFKPGMESGLTGVAGGKLRYQPVSNGRPEEGIRGPIIARWMAEFHTGVLSELARLDIDWYTPIRFGSSGHKLAIFEQPKSTIFSEDRSAPESWHRSTSDENYAQLLAAASAMAPGAGVPTNVTGDSRATLDEFEVATLTNAFQDAAIHAHALRAQFAPSNAVSRVVKTTVPIRGATALELLVPNVTELPWEAICEFRAHKGAEEARHLMREFEQRAAESGPEDGVAYLASVARDVTRAYADAVNQMRPKLPVSMAEQVASTAVGLVPLIGPVASLVTGSARAALDLSNYSRSWVAAVMTLQKV